MMGYIAGALVFEWAKRNLFDAPNANVPGAEGHAHRPAPAQGGAKSASQPGGNSEAARPALDQHLAPNIREDVYARLDRGDPDELEFTALQLAKLRAPVAAEICAREAEWIRAAYAEDARLASEIARQEQVFQAQTAEHGAPLASVAGQVQAAAAAQPQGSRGPNPPKQMIAFRPPQGAAASDEQHAPVPANVAPSPTMDEYGYVDDPAARAEAERQSKLQKKLAEKSLEQWKLDEANRKQKDRISLALQVAERDAVSPEVAIQKLPGHKGNERSDLAALAAHTGEVNGASHPAPVEVTDVQDPTNGVAVQESAS